MSLPKASIAIMVSIFVSVLSTYFILSSQYSSTKTTCPVLGDSNIDYSTDLKEIKTALNSLQTKQQNILEVVGNIKMPVGGSEISIPVTLGSATIAGTKSNIDVYEKPLVSSKVLGKAINGKTYIVLAKEGNWYRISLNEYVEGWVLASQVVFTEQTI